MSVQPNFQKTTLGSGDTERKLVQLEQNTEKAFKAVALQAEALFRPTNQKTAAYTAVVDDLVVCSGTFNVTLPVATSLNQGRWIGVIVKSGTVTVASAAPLTCLVQNAVSDALATVGLRLYISDGVGWWRAP